MSNSLSEYQSVSTTLSNELAATQSTIALNAEQLTNLNRHITDLESKNQTMTQTFGQRIVDLTNQVAVLEDKLATTQTNLEMANKNYALLENRLRRAVADQIISQRKFNNVAELEAQLRKLEGFSGPTISSDSIYAGLDVEVKSNGTFHVLSPD